MRILLVLFLFIAMIGNAQSEFSTLQPNTTLGTPVYLSLSEVVYIAREQSPDALIAKHRFRRSYWEFRSFRAGYLPNMRLDATMPNFNRTIDPITQADGSESYRERTLARYSTNLSLNSVSD
jgi:outer membrane protein TolC